MGGSLSSEYKIDAVGKQPKLSMTNVELVNMCGNDIHVNTKNRRAKAEWCFLSPFSISSFAK
jgi:hypothetical protein